jgi:Ser/Thr protein kinase RdoA (MazF antagonist)
VRTAETDPLRSPPPAFGLPEAERVAEQVFGIPGSLFPLASERDQNFRLDDGQGRAFLFKISNPADDEALIRPKRS